MAAPTLQDLGQMSIEELASIDVSSVSKTSQSLAEAPAAIYVITAEDAIRSGATSLAEILRLAPNLQVARIKAHSYAISSRGFNTSAADKLLVLIDGRSVYTPLLHGVFWDAVDVPVETIERIEVISGPGATLWGANAVNGVINVVTKSATPEDGLRLQLGGGSRNRRIGAQYSAALGDEVALRAYARGVDYDSGRTALGANARDAWNKWQGGFRLDWTRPDSLLTLQGDAYDGSEEQPTTADLEISGYNLIGRWTGRLAGGELSVQAYYDHLERTTPDRTDNRQRTYDLDIRHSFKLGSAHEVVWGGGYRVTDDRFIIRTTPTAQQSFIPPERTLRFGNLFVQDTVTLAPTLKLTLGVKFEDDPYAGVEALPSARLSWMVSDQTLLWAAVSRAVRAPSRFDRDLTIIQGSAVIFTGGDFQPENLVAYEVGYRGRPTPRSSLSVSAFYNVYDDLRSFELTNGAQPIVAGNLMKGETYGLEAWGAFQATDWWRLSAGLSWLHKELRFEPGSARIGGLRIAGNDPEFQASLRSSMRLAEGLNLELDLRHVDDLPDPFVPAYTELGAQVRWAVTDRLEVVVTGSNLLAPHHPEFGSSGAAESERSVFVDTRWRF